MAAAVEMVEDLSNRSRFRPSLRIQGVQGHPGVFEMSWSSDGRVTFAYGPQKLPGEPHIIWRRVGGHEVLSDP